jgi:hypothetical protein
MNTALAVERSARLEKRIVGEITRALSELQSPQPMVTVFGSARTKPWAPAYEMALSLARRLGGSGFGIITGGGPGIMAAANRGAQEANALSLGASIVLPDEQQSNAYLDREVRFEFFFARKLALLRASCGFLCFPGGFGTVDELFEALTLIQTGKLPHFPLVLFGTSYWKGLVDWLVGPMAESGAIGARGRELLVVTDDPAEAVERFVECHRTLCATMGPGPHYPALGDIAEGGSHGYG